MTVAPSAERPPLSIGDITPWFRQRCIGRAEPFSFDTAAGRFITICLYGAASDPEAQRALGFVADRSQLFDGLTRQFFGVSADPVDEADPSLFPRAGVQHFADADDVVAKALGFVPRAGRLDKRNAGRGWLVLDPRLRVLATFPLDEQGGLAALRYTEGLPTPAAYFGDAPAPVLLAPHVFESSFNTRLIEAFSAHGGEDSAVLTDAGPLQAHGFKRRRDWRIADRALVAEVQSRIIQRIAPDIAHAFQFKATRMERLIVACYDAAEGGRFGPHRDNTVAASAHRRFAVSLNLNDDFEGGGLVFPEYGARAYRPAAGAALVFSCSLMHAVLPVTKGRRYACLPFLYDETAAQGRSQKR